jgi:dTDP-4-amino-4,6-dideoxygalactose transaminase
VPGAFGVCRHSTGYFESRRITNRRATHAAHENIVPVHYAGVARNGSHPETENTGCGCEDNARGLFARYRGRYLGTLGSIATQSFHETKNVTCGEGGAIVINDPGLVERAEILRDKGTNRSRFYRGEVDKYTWVDVGSSYLMSDILAAFLCAQLEAYEQIAAARCRIWTFYFNELSGWASEMGVQVPFVPPHCEQPHHILPHNALTAGSTGATPASEGPRHYERVPPCSSSLSPPGLSSGRSRQCPVSAGW